MTQTTPKIHPLVDHMFELLPPPDTMWVGDARAQWLQTVADIFTHIYHGCPRAVRVTAVYHERPKHGERRT